MAEHYCKEHRTIWFRKGKMRGYAHPIVDENGEPTGEWCNEPEPKEETPTKEITKPAQEPQKPQMSREDWAEKDKITRKSIERQTALNAAVECAKLLITLHPERITSEAVISTAKRFELYLETGIDVAAQANKAQEVKGAKTNLVAAIKAQGDVLCEARNQQVQDDI